MNSKSIKNLRNIVVIVFIIGGLFWVSSKFIHFGNVEYTDNAQIRRSIVPISSRVQGCIQKVFFDDFQYVHKGDTLVVIDNTEYRLKAVLAKADYQDAVAESSSGLAVEGEAGRVKDGEKHRPTKVEVAKAAYDLARLNLTYTAIVAPCDGITSRKTVREGQFVQPGQTLLSLVEYDDVWIIANYKETQMKNIREGMPVSIKVDALPDMEFHGKVAGLSNATGAQYSMIPQDNSAGNFVKVEQKIPVKIVFTEENNKDDINRLRSGMNVECEINY